jgi:ribonuclease HI
MATRRRLYYAVRHGWFRGVFRHRNIALRATEHHPNPKMQTFFSRVYADAYVYYRENNIQRSVVYTDGSYRKRHNTAGYGVFFGSGDRRNIGGRVQLSCVLTSQYAEAYAVLAALLLTVGPVEIRTDSLQLVYKVTRPRAATDPMTRCIQHLSQNRCVIWTYIPAHAGYVGNEHADDLARAGSIPFWTLNRKTYKEALLGTGSGSNDQSRLI